MLFLGAVVTNTASPACYRNPMNAVVGVTDILLDTAGLSDEQTNYVEVIRTSGQHLLTVSLTLLLLSALAPRP